MGQATNMLTEQRKNGVSQAKANLTKAIKQLEHAVNCYRTGGHFAHAHQLGRAINQLKEVQTDLKKFKVKPS